MSNLAFATGSSSLKPQLLLVRSATTGASPKPAYSAGTMRPKWPVITAKPTITVATSSPVVLASGTALEPLAVDSGTVAAIAQPIKSAQDKAWADLELLFATLDARGDLDDDFDDDWLNEARASWDSNLEELYGAHGGE
jgi:hypothetical protein